MTSKNSTIIDLARRYLAAGFSPIPLVPGDKRPSVKGWQRYGEEPMGWGEADKMFADTDSIGIVCGYDGLEVLDIDAKHFDGDELNEFTTLLDAEAPGLRSKMTIQQTRSGGEHWIYKCDNVEGNQKLARNIEGETTFETRGVGGQIVVFPSPGYKMKTKITLVQRITPDEREILFRCARLTSSAPRVVTIAHDLKLKSEISAKTPWGEFRETHTALEILESNGWKIVGQNAKYTYLKRPGDTDAKTSGVIFNDTGLFWPWTTSTDFVAEKPHDAFQCYVTLECRGDFKEAFRQLASRGYGAKYAPENIPPSDDDDEQITDDEMMAHLMTLEVDSTIPVERPPVAVDVFTGLESFVLGSLGNFVLIQGKAKSRKSYLVSAIAAAALSENVVAEALRGYIGDKVVLYIDTEQGDWHAARAKKRILNMAGLDPLTNNERLKYFKFRGLDRNAERFAFVEFALERIPNIGLVVIDGIVDLASKGVNDEEEATEIASRLLKWTSVHNCMLVAVLHENKNDRNAKGHLGAYLVQKAESVIGVAKNEHDASASTITPEYTRNIEFPTLTMRVNNDDTITLGEHEESDFYELDRVWSPDDLQRIAKKIDGKMKTEIVPFIRDTETAKQKEATKAFNLMLDQGIVTMTSGRPQRAVYNDHNDEIETPF
jgi:hypothetical protein